MSPKPSDSHGMPPVNPAFVARVRLIGSIMRALVYIFSFGFFLAPAFTDSEGFLLFLFAVSANAFAAYGITSKRVLAETWFLTGSLTVSWVIIVWEHLSPAVNFVAFFLLALALIPCIFYTANRHLLARLTT